MIRRPPRPVGESIVVFAGLDWWYHNRAHADFQLAERLSSRARVLVVNSIGTRMPRPGRTSDTAGRLRRKMSAILRGVRRPIPHRPDLFVFSPLVIPAYGTALGGRAATALVRIQVAMVASWLRLGRPTSLVTPPTAGPVAAALHSRRTVYLRTDKHSAIAGATERLRLMERELLTTADHVIYVSEALLAEDAPLVGDRAEFLGHGVDVALFHPDGPVADQMAGLPRPVLGYFGNLRDHAVDATLLERLAVEFPDASLVLVGPVSMSLGTLPSRSNVHMFGPVPHDHVPTFGRGFDVALMPWRNNEWIRSCNPIKLKEYLALGLPIVTTDFPMAHGWPVAVADSHDRFVEAVRAAVSGSEDREGLRACVLDETWDAKAAQLRVILESERSPRTGSSR